jgi:SprT protein
MRLPEQLKFVFDKSTSVVAASLWEASGLAQRSGSKEGAKPIVVGQALRLPEPDPATPKAFRVTLQLHGRDRDLEVKTRELLRASGASRIAGDVHVEWNPRLKSCAGRADYRAKLIFLNQRLHEFGPAEIDRTLRHELAHLLAQFRAGRRRILPHGKEWRAACHDLGIDGEKRCHNLPFPIRERLRRFFYKCPNCQRDFARVRRIRRAIACLTCCRAHNGGAFDPRFQLVLVNRVVPTRC